MTASNDSSPFLDLRARDLAETATEAEADGVAKRHSRVSSSIYWGVHASCLLALLTGVNATALTLCVALFLLRIFAITGFYHRYFSHRTFRTSRPMQFLIGLLGTSAVQKGPLWWASLHRLHHRHSDHEGDPHNSRMGFWYCHQGWIMDGRWDETRLEQVRDLAKFPELMWLNRWHFVAPIGLAVFCYAAGGFSGLVWGFSISTVITWHATYCINSLAHKIGRVRYETGEDSKNSLLLALLTLGEGWHNNHHHHQSCARQGFYWYEIDITYYILRALQAVGLIWDIKEPPASVYQQSTPTQPLREAA